MASRPAWRGRFRRIARPIVGALALTCAVLGAAPPALGNSIQHEFAAFSDCPVESLSEEGVCVISTVTSGEFVLGSSAVPINKTITLQGGVEGTTLVPAVDGNTLSKTPLQVPGGLIGIEVLPPLTEVTATAELAGTGLVNLGNALEGKGTAVGLPLQVKLDNPLLSSTCYVGSPSEPVALNLTTGTTNPPPPNQPISGSPGKPVQADGAPGITGDVGISLVDNSFAAPGANGCGLLPLTSIVVDPVVDLRAGIPAASGHNTAIMNGTTLITEPNLVKHWATLPELGRCSRAPFTKVGREKVFHGDWITATCTTESTGAQKFGEFEWYAGPGAGNKFTVAEGATTFETKSGQKLTCSKATGSGEYSGTKASTVTLKLVGCKLSTSKAKCQSAGANAGEIVTSALQGKLGFIEDRYVEKNEVLSVGIDISAPTLLSANCGTQAIAVSGSAIGKLTPTDEMTKSFVLQFSQAGGSQQPEAFEEQPADTLSMSVGGGTPETAGLSAKVKLVNQEKLAIKDNV